MSYTTCQENSTRRSISPAVHCRKKRLCVLDCKSSCNTMLLTTRENHPVDATLLPDTQDIRNYLDRIGISYEAQEQGLLISELPTQKAITLDWVKEFENLLPQHEAFAIMVTPKHGMATTAARFTRDIIASIPLLYNLTENGFGTFRFTDAQREKLPDRPTLPLPPQPAAQPPLPSEEGIEVFSTVFPLEDLDGKTARHVYRILNDAGVGFHTEREGVVLLTVPEGYGPLPEWMRELSAHLPRNAAFAYCHPVTGGYAIAGKTNHRYVPAGEPPALYLRALSLGGFGEFTLSEEEDNFEHRAFQGAYQRMRSQAQNKEDISGLRVGLMNLGIALTGKEATHLWEWYRLHFHKPELAFPKDPKEAQSLTEKIARNLMASYPEASKDARQDTRVTLQFPYVREALHCYERFTQKLEKDFRVKTETLKESAANISFTFTSKDPEEIANMRKTFAILGFHTLSHSKETGDIMEAAKGFETSHYWKPLYPTNR